MIDAVVTWVDGNDPIHRAKRLRYQGSSDASAESSGLRETRFKECGELWFCVHLIRKHAPWIGTIHLVTDDQRPTWLTRSLQERLGVRLVDHSVLFRGLEDYLPTFSSRSIETLLYNIPGIADRFVYFNDDVLLVNPVSETNYFAADQCLMKGQWQSRASLPRKLVREVNRTFAWYFPFSTFRDGYSARRGEHHLLEECKERFFSLAHTPFPMSTPFMREVIHSSGLFTNARYRFRDKRQFNPVSYCAHVGFSRGVVLQGLDDWEYITCAKHSARVTSERLRRCETDSTIASLCVQSLEMAKPRTREMIEGFLRRCLER